MCSMHHTGLCDAPTLHRLCLGNVWLLSSQHRLYIILHRYYHVPAKLITEVVIMLTKLRTQEYKLGPLSLQGLIRSHVGYGDGDRWQLYHETVSQRDKKAVQCYLSYDEKVQQCPNIIFGLVLLETSCRVWLGLV
jgi:hypothetical protein